MWYWRSERCWSTSPIRLVVFWPSWGENIYIFSVVCQNIIWTVLVLFRISLCSSDQCCICLNSLSILQSVRWGTSSVVVSSAYLLNPFATTDAYIRQYFHCLQWYAGSERVNELLADEGLSFCAFITYSISPIPEPWTMLLVIER